DLAGDGERGGLGGGRAHHHVHVMAGALGVGHELAGQDGADRAHRLGQLTDVRGDAAGTGGHQDHGVVGGHAGVGVDPVEGGGGGLSQHRVGGVGVDVGVGGQNHQHGRQLRSEHPGALGDAADPHPGIRGAFGGLGDGVGGHDRSRGGRVGLGAGGEPRGPGGDAREQRPHRQALTDQAGRADQHVGGGGLERCGQVLGGAPGVGQALGAGAGVGAPGVQDHGAGPAGGHGFARPDHGGGLDPVGGEHGGGALARPVIDDQGEIGGAGGFQSGGQAGGAEAA